MGRTVHFSAGSTIEPLEHRRLLSDAGQLDTTFDIDGRAAMPFGAGQLIGLQPGGKHRVGLKPNLH